LLKSKTLHFLIDGCTEAQFIYTLQSFFRTKNIYRDATLVEFKTDFDPFDYQKTSIIPITAKRKILYLDSCKISSYKNPFSMDVYEIHDRETNKNIMYNIYFDKCQVIKLEGDVILIKANQHIINELDTLCKFFMKNIKKFKDPWIYHDGKEHYIKLHGNRYADQHNIKFIDFINRDSKISAECAVRIYSNKSLTDRNQLSSGFKMFIRNIEVFNKQLVLTKEMLDMKPVIINNSIRQIKPKKVTPVLDNSDDEDVPEKIRTPKEASSNEEDYEETYDVPITRPPKESSSEEEEGDYPVTRPKESSSEEEEDYVPVKRDVKKKDSRKSKK